MAEITFVFDSIHELEDFLLWKERHKPIVSTIAGCPTCKLSYDIIVKERDIIDE